MSDGMKIALVSAFPPGRQSLNEYGLHLAKGLAARDDVAEVVVIADKLPTPMAELDLGPKIRVLRVWRFNSAGAGPAIVSALLKERAEGAIWNLQIASFGDKEVPAALGLIGPAAARACGVPSGVIAHNLVSGVDLNATHLQGQHWRQRLVQFGGALVTRALLQATYMTVTLRSYQDDLRAAFPQKPVHLIPHGTFDTDVTAPAPLAGRQKRIVTMGKFGTYKRLETLITAFNQVRSDPQFADYQLVIGGSDHPNTPGYMDSVARDNADNPAIRFHGYVAEEGIPDFFNDAQLSVFDYSATTGSSGVLHQTASYGAVPVFPKIGDFVDVCRDEGLAGFNYAPNDADSMADAIRSALSNPAEAQTIADTNCRAAMDMPFADVVEFHVRQLRDARPVTAAKAAERAHA